MSDEQRRLEAMMSARHAILALRQLHDVPDGATGQGTPITVGCVTRDLGQMAEQIRTHFLGDTVNDDELRAELDAAQRECAELHDALEAVRVAADEALAKVRERGQAAGWAQAAATVEAARRG